MLDPDIIANLTKLRTVFNTINDGAKALKATQGAGNVGNIAQALGGGAANLGGPWLENIIQGYWKNMAEAPARAVYNRLTDIEAGARGTGLQADSSKFFTASNKNIPRENLRPGEDPSGYMPLNPLREHPGKREGLSTVFEIPNVSGNSNFAAVVNRGTSTPFGKNVGPDPVTPAGQEWAQVFYDNPELTAKAVGTTIGIGTPLAAGAFLQNFAQGSKPRSVYAAPVTPARGGYDTNYNPSVESARAAAEYRHELEEQKFRHKMALQDARQEARTPGVQGTWGGAHDVNSMVDKLYNNRPQYF